MTIKPAAFFRTTLPLDLGRLAELDSGRYEAIWLPDHFVSLWPDAIWTPEFTDLATGSRSPHRYLDGLGVAMAAAALTRNVTIATSVVDTARRHPALLAQTALTLSHVSQGRFILGLGCGEAENVTRYGFDFAAPVSRLEEAVQVIRLLWETDGPVDFKGRFYSLHRARLDAEPYGGQFPPIWLGGSGPRMLELAGRHADGWWPVGNITPETYATMLATLREAAERAGRDPSAITPAGYVICLIGEDDELEEMLRAPLIKAYILQIRGDFLRQRGFAHPMGEDWKGIHDFDPGAMTREMLVDLLGRVDPRAILAALPHGPPKRIGAIVKAYVDAGVSIPNVLDYGGMAGLKFAARSAQKVREAEDEFMRLMGARS